MAKVRPIRTPWKQQWRRIRYQLLPVFVFGGATLLTISLWRRHAGLPNAVGSVEDIRYEMAAPIGGVLVPMARVWQRFDEVEANDVIARFDDAPIRAAINVQRQQIARLQARLAEERAQFAENTSELARSMATFDYTAMLNARRLAADVEQLHINILDRKGDIAADTVEYQRQKERFSEIEKLADRGVETRWAYWNARLRRDVVKERLDNNLATLDEAGKQLTAAITRRDEQFEKLKDMPNVDLASLDSTLDTIRADIKVQEAQITELEAQARNTVIRSPVRGVISEIFRRPREAVTAGMPLMTISADLPEKYVIAYLREHQGVRPKPDMPVLVRLRTFPRKPLRGHITQVGPRVELVPRHHLGDPRNREWGLPVRIAIPPTADVRPGELVDVTFGIARD